jgi:hypothetical protein
MAPETLDIQPPLTAVWKNTFPSISSLLMSEPDVTFLMFFSRSFTLAEAGWTEEVDLLGDRARLLEGMFTGSPIWEERGRDGGGKGGGKGGGRGEREGRGGRGI